MSKRALAVGLKPFIWFIGLLLLQFMSAACQRLRQDIDDLKLRCGAEANLGDIAEWIEVSTENGRPEPSSINAALIDKDLKIENLVISSRGCVGVPAKTSSFQWLVIRAAEAGAFGKVLAPSDVRFRRVVLQNIPNETPRFDCPKPQSGAFYSTANQLSLDVSIPDLLEPGSVFFDFNIKSLDMKSSVNLKLISADPGRFKVDLDKVPEGNYQAALRIIPLFNFQSGLKDSGRECPIAIDRSPPKLELLNNKNSLLEAKIRVQPGEFIEFRSADLSQTKIFSCWVDALSISLGDCGAYTESGGKFSAPAEGDWQLSIYAEDAVGNRAPTQVFKIAVFDSERIGKITAWIEAARLQLKQSQNFLAYKLLTKASLALEKLKSKDEQTLIREKMLGPLVHLMFSYVPYNQINLDKGILQSIRGTAENEYVIHTIEDRRKAHELRLYRVDGTLLVKKQFEAKTLVAFDQKDLQFLIWRPSGQLEFYSRKLELIRDSFLKRSLDESEKIIGISGNVALIGQENNLYFIDSKDDILNTFETENRDKISAGLSFDGSWLAVANGDGVDFMELDQGKVSHATLDFEIQEIQFAAERSFLCLKGKNDLLCGSPIGLAAGNFILKTNKAGNAYAMDQTGKRIAYAGENEVFFLDLEKNTHYKKPYLQRVRSLFVDPNGKLQIYCNKGVEAFDDLPLDPTPMVVDFVGNAPKLDQSWLASGKIYERDPNELRKSLYVRESDVKGRWLAFKINMERLQKATAELLPGGKYFAVSTQENRIEVYPIDDTLSLAFQTDCSSFSFDSLRCVVIEKDQVTLNELGKGSMKVASKHIFNKALSSPTVSWHPKNSDALIFYNGMQVQLWAIEQGIPSLIFDRKFSETIGQVTWIGSSFVALQFFGGSLQVVDWRKGESVWASQPGRSMENMFFKAPIDFAPEINSFITVAKIDGIKEPVLEVWALGNDKPTAQYQFSDTDMEWAEVVKYNSSRGQVVVGFHHGYVYLLDGFLKPNIAIVPYSLDSHQDIIYEAGFSTDSSEIFTMSQDGSVLLHKGRWGEVGDTIVRKSFSNQGGYFEDKDWFWISYWNDSLELYNRNGDEIESFVIRELPSGVNFIGSMLISDSSIGRLALPWRDFLVGQALCKWSTYWKTLVQTDADFSIDDCKNE